MPRRALLLSCLAALGSQLSAGCCCWRPFAHCWAGHETCASCVGGGPVAAGPPGCASCGSSPLAGGPPAGPVLTGPPPGYAGYTVSAAPVMQQGSVFTGPPTASFPGATVTPSGPTPR